jgi:hypothetical protein
LAYTAFWFDALVGGPRDKTAQRARVDLNRWPHSPEPSSPGRPAPTSAQLRGFVVLGVGPAPVRLDNVLDVLEVWLSLELTSGAGRNIVVAR